MTNKSHKFRGLANLCLMIGVSSTILGQIASTWNDKVMEVLGATQEMYIRSDDMEDYRFKSDFEKASDLIQAQIDINTRLAAEGSVLLKGEAALPGKAVSLFGMRIGEKMQFGASMGELTAEENIVTLSEALEANGFNVNPALTSFYQEMATNYAPTKAPGGNLVSDYSKEGAIVGEVPISEYQSINVEGYQDAAIIVLGRDAGESASFYPGSNGIGKKSEFTKSPTGNILSLSNDERDLVNWVKSQDFGKIIVLINSGTSMEIEELKQDDEIDSIMWVGNPGAYGTYGIAKLLNGEMLPSGHLPDTFAVNQALSPAAQNVGIFTFTNADELDSTNNHGLRNQWYVSEDESIYIGYKYYETRYFDSILENGNAKKAKPELTANNTGIWNYDNEVSYGFGFGIEGSTFEEEIVDSSIDWTGKESSTMTIKVTNTGDKAAKHAVQLYVSVPYTETDKEKGVEKSSIQLIGYAKTGEASEETYQDIVLLEPGASEEVVISFNVQDFYSYDRNFEHDDTMGAWVLSAGDYYFATGNGAHDAVQRVLKEQYPDKMTEVEPTGVVVKETLDKEETITESNGVLIQNQLDDAQLAYWDESLAQPTLSRNDWDSTFPTARLNIAATDSMKTYLNNKFYDSSEDEKTYEGPSEFVYNAKHGVRAVDLVGLEFDDPKYEQILEQLSLASLANHYLSYNQPIKEISLPVELRADSPLGFITKYGQHTSNSVFALDSSDEANGYKANNYVSAPIVAATYSPFLQAEQGRILANDAIWSGYNTWYGPGLNLHRTPFNGRNLAYYSEDSVLMGQTATNVVKMMDQYGIVTNAKHFAFNDQETNRDGVAVFITEQGARENELRGYQIPIRDGNLNAMMSSFNRIGVTHTATHRGLMNGILRGEWGFNGYMITDSVKSSEYFQPREALMVGNDLMLGASNNAKAWSFTEKDLENDIVLQAKLRESMHRKLYTYAKSIMFNGINNDSDQANQFFTVPNILYLVGGISIIGFLGSLFKYIHEEKKERG